MTKGLALHPYSKFTRYGERWDERVCSGMGAKSPGHGSSILSEGSNARCMCRLIGRSPNGRAPGDVTKLCGKADGAASGTASRNTKIQDWLKAWSETSGGPPPMRQKARLRSLWEVSRTVVKRQAIVTLGNQQRLVVWSGTRLRRYQTGQRRWHQDQAEPQQEIRAETSP